MNEGGTKSYYPEQKLTIDQAIAAYTTGSALAEFAEREKGTLAPGMLADFVVLDRDITKVPAAEILKTQVLRTVVGGKTVYWCNTTYRNGKAHLTVCAHESPKSE
jgi:predicted amidohydrolase YtcJ